MKEDFFAGSNQFDSIVIGQEILSEREENNGD